MPEHIASIVHVSDLHLHVNAAGELRSSPAWLGRMQHNLIERFPGAPLVKGMNWHDELALPALERDLAAAAERERRSLPDDAPLLAVQTGDVEALGGLPAEHLGWRDAFPSWAYVDDLLRGCDLGWLHVFGNHDTWPGTVPFFAALNTRNRDRIGHVDLVSGPWDSPTQIQTPAGIPLVVARVNSVARTLAGEVLASGALNAVPPDAGNRFTILNDARRMFRPVHRRPAVRIVLMHHPPHAFQANFGARHTIAAFDDATLLAPVLERMRVQLVIAGHRHRLDPPLGEEDYGFSQAPLRAPTVQLVAESPTQRVSEDELAGAGGDLDAGSNRSFCVYRLYVDDETLSVGRIVFEYLLGAGGFRPGPEERVFTQLPLQ